ncbi:MAG: hypothetical protein Q7R98_03725 [Candidatus Jorgensenbacteria bacterium]|nr:hypothetical protein [Candidatus Jorgensenbacteria bacterium]
MKKEEIVSVLEKLFLEKEKNLTKTLEETRDSACGAPGSNISHSDTSKFQLSELALSLEKQTREANEALVSIRNTPVCQSSAVQVGSLVELEEKSSSKRTLYFVIPKGGGETVQVGDSSVTTITAAAPLARACVGKKENEEVSINGRTYIIRNLE